MIARDFQKSLQIETAQLEIYMNFAGQKCDDIYAIKCYQHKDDSLLYVMQV